jgi:hypothetical protein
MSISSDTSREAAGKDDGYAEAQAAVAQQQRRELVAKVRELRRQRDGARERARKADQRFERAVVLLASEKPDREDWYEYPGALPRKTLAEASGLNTVQLHRTMERHRKAGAKQARKPRTRVAPR